MRQIFWYSGWAGIGGHVHQNMHASLGPDIDLPTSKSGRIFFWISTHLEKHFGHKTITHSWIGMLIVIILASLVYLYQPMYF